MNHEATFVVVDIETTGTNLKDDRIIQIGCVFIKNNKIVSRYATDVNPQRKISKQIENLTGISNEQVATAPYFEDVAFEISQLISGCVFVAHNIYFDYQFLNAELTRCGAPAMTNAGVDTVELAQIFWPTSPSFRLNDLAEQAGVRHTRPHQADSDAEVTAEILILIAQKMRKLPLVTMESIVELADQCGMETQAYIASIYQEMLLAPVKLSPNLEIIERIALQKKVVPTFNYQERFEEKYPDTKEKKELLFQKELNYRENQSQMMDLSYTFFSSTTIANEQKNLGIEVPTGNGKTFGYLFPLSYLATPESPVIISTISIVLENQLIQEGIPLVNRLHPESLVGTLVKSQRHYLDLEAFANTLKVPKKQKQYALHQMGVLVWLTETLTGDLGELNLTTLKHRFFEEVHHRGNDYLLANSAYYQVDFWRHLQARMKQSNVIVVNHAFLCQENFRRQPLLPASPYLIIDEAHHLAEISQQAGGAKFSTYKIDKSLAHIFYDDNRPEFIPDLWDLPVWQQPIKSLKLVVQELQQLVELVKEDLIEYFVIDCQRTFNEEFTLTNDDLEHMPIYTSKHLHQLDILLQEFSEYSQQVETLYVQELTSWTPVERFALTDWLDDLAAIHKQALVWRRLFKPAHSNLVKWLKISDKYQEISATYTDFAAHMIEHTNWYQRYTQILYTGGTISLAEDHDYLARSLGLTSFPVYSFSSQFNYAEQARLFVPTDIGQANFNSQTYINYLCNSLILLVKGNPRSVLVLFTSHELLQTVYQRLHYKLLSEGVEVLGQGISGSREKIVKRFSQSEHALLLGTDSFWEGIDLPGEALEIIVITRLPFESPDRPFIKEKYLYLENIGVNTFRDYALPKAALSLRQGVGRLIRSETDRGVLLVFDQRLLTATYSPVLRSALPSNLPINKGKMTDIIKEIEDFL